MEHTRGIPERRVAFLETCFDVLCENGLEHTSLKMLADACGVTNGNLIYYFGTKDNIVIESTAYCMAKVEDDFMERAPRDYADIERFLQEMPYVTAELHGAKYRTMYQVYSSPSYMEHGREFFRGVNVRYRQYAETLSGNLGLPVDFIQGVIYVFVRACVHYAMFEDEEYLKLQLQAIRTSLSSCMGRTHDELDGTVTERWRLVTDQRVMTSREPSTDSVNR